MFKFGNSLFADTGIINTINHKQIENVTGICSSYDNCTLSFIHDDREFTIRTTTNKIAANTKGLDGNVVLT